MAKLINGNNTLTNLQLSLQNTLPELWPGTGREYFFLSVLSHGRAVHIDILFFKRPTNTILISQKELFALISKMK